jgi:hypothetical protein
MDRKRAGVAVSLIRIGSMIEEILHGHRVAARRCPEERSPSMSVVRIRIMSGCEPLSERVNRTGLGGRDAGIGRADPACHLPGTPLNVLCNAPSDLHRMHGVRAIKVLV